MKRNILSLFALLAAILPLNAHDVCLMQFNVWQEGTMVPGGFEAIAAEIARQKPDIVMLSEVRNYGGTRFCDRITAELKKHGLDYHSFHSYDSGLLSLTEITDSVTIYPHSGDHGTAYKLVTHIDGQRIAAYTTHMDYQNDTYYEVRGYDGNSWREIPSLTDRAEITRRNLLSERDEEARAIAADVAHERELGSIIFAGGDLNEPSGLDWTESTAQTADHRGVIIDWPTLAILRQAGLADAYRTVHSDPLTNPGYTYPCSNPLVPIEKLTWAPKADERERIDYLFFIPNPRMQILSADIIGPTDDIIRGERVATPWATRDVTPPLSTWPSDHRAVLARFRLTLPSQKEQETGPESD